MVPPPPPSPTWRPRAWSVGGSSRLPGRPQPEGTPRAASGRGGRAREETHTRPTTEAFLVSFALVAFIPTTAVAAELPKEGTFATTFTIIDIDSKGMETIPGR